MVGMTHVRLESSRPGDEGTIRFDQPDVELNLGSIGKGYALESAVAVMKYGRDVLSLKRVLAITTQDNESSGKLLEKLGFKFENLIKMPTDDEELKLFSTNMQ